MGFPFGGRFALDGAVLLTQGTGAPTKPDIVTFDRAYALAIARKNFPKVMRGVVKATALIMIFDASGHLVRGFPVVGGIAIAVAGDSLSLAQRMAVQRSAAYDGNFGRDAGRAGRGSGGAGAASPRRGGRGGYIVGFGMSLTRDSLGKMRPRPANHSDGLTEIPAAGDVSGIVGIPATAITYVDEFPLFEGDGFASPFDLLAVHLAPAHGDAKDETVVARKP